MNEAEWEVGSFTLDADSVASANRRWAAESPFRAMTTDGGFEVRAGRRVLWQWKASRAGYPAFAGVTTLPLVVLLFGAFSYAARFEVVQAERIEMLGRDGQPDLILAGEGYVPGPIVGGREFSPDLSAGGSETAGMALFNARGGEVGGLIYGGGWRDSTREAFGALKFDQYQQDQVVGLQHSERGGVRRAGVDVWDRLTNSTRRRAAAPEFDRHVPPPPHPRSRTDAPGGTPTWRRSERVEGPMTAERSRSRSRPASPPWIA